MEEHSETKIFSVRIVSIDYYMSLPIPDIDISYSTFHGEKAKDVPVIRVYGSTPSGQKACVHIHGALPYLYVPVSDIQSHESFQGDAYKNALCLSLEKALKLKGSTGSKRQHVHGCSVVRGRKLYGYYSLEELFLKIYFYYPQDVSRAANLLLGGQILERSLQPHESHIPFLLQFLVDYNLFGMGHLHLVKIKFRPPVPDDFCPSRGDMTSVNDVVVTADSQADSSSSSPSSSQVWKASNIPEGWSWQCSGGVSASLDASNSLVKRQSICELEGDTTVDDILNQQYKLSVSLSQTPSDVKMVQSLIPIWQEEYERSGIHEAEVLPDPAKPSPDTVLKTFSSGLDFEHQLFEFCGKLDKALYPSAANDEASSQCFTSSSMDDFQHRAEDGEAEALLKWLASSQAAEDINSDDELIRETILMPLLPSETVDKVIETANVGYENESQQECQDILDSVEDVMDFEGGKQKNYSVDCVDSQEKNIPQVDGAGVDDRWNSPASSSNEESTEPQHQQLQHTSTVSEGKRKGQHPLWAPLPFSGVQICNMHHDKGPGGPKNNSLAASSNPSGCIAATGLVEQDSKTLIGCSLRDLMRKKRCYQFDLKSASGEQAKETCDMLEYKTNQSKEEVMLTLKSSDLEHVATVDKIKYFDSPNSCFEPCAIDAHDSRLVVTEFPVSSIIESSGQATTSEGRCCRSSEKLDHRSNLYEHNKASKNKVHAIASESFNQFIEVSPDNTIYHEWDDHHFDAFLENKSEVQVDRENPKCCNTGQYDNSLTCKELQWEGASASSCLQVCGNGVTEMIHGGDLTNSVRSHHEFLVGPKDKGDAESLTSVLLGNLNEKEKIVSGCLTSVSGRSAIEEKVLNECISMTFHKKPPTVNCLNLTSENTILGYTSIVDSNNPLGQGGYLDDIPEFFRDDCPRELEDVNRCNVSREVVHDLAMGVPIHYQNDGSYSYLLTPAFSPPSVDLVCNWISVESTESIPSSSNGSRDMLFLNQPLSRLSEELFFLPVVDKWKQGDVKNSGADEHVLHSKIIGVLPAEGNFTKAGGAQIFSEDISQISGPTGRSKSTPLSQIGFRDPASLGAGQQLTLCSIEVLAESRGDLRPDPVHDSINIISLAVQNDGSSMVDVHLLLRSATSSNKRKAHGIPDYKVKFFSEERELLDRFVVLICSYDPDILMGWDIQGGSLGFLAERASHLGISLLNKISRTPSETKLFDGDSEIEEKDNENIKTANPAISDSAVLVDTVIKDEWGRTHASGVHVGGRIILNVWRLMRGEVKLNMYTIESVAEAVLRRKVPFFCWKLLNKWFSCGSGRAGYRCLDYIVKKTKMSLEIINQLDMVNRTSELARVFGIDFFSVTNRGSQYRVESMLMRLAHMQNYIAISPGYQQVASQPAMECLPLVMEPESGFYVDPVIVLDFQSLYPSMIIAYNLCFSTCLGKVVPSKAATLGVSTYSPDLHTLRDLKQDILFTPNGVMFVPSKVRKGVLPRLLEEILSTRIMVKKALKKYSSKQILHRILNARQLALKLIANVTYGYTAAGFSGRMPCAELADSIVQCGRRTLETAISFVNTHKKWNARVIYGDTDSMFVLLKGRTKEEAFLIGQDIASAITAMNPNPVALKMEKVYQPCFLLTKKRYVGYSYESTDQVEPNFDAKGIETVRRDTCRAVSKMMEKTLKIYFERQNIYEVKAYLERQWTRILSGRVSIQEFVFAKEVRLGSYSLRCSASLPPAAIVAIESMRSDPRAEPRYGERVPYVVIHGEPGARLVDMVVDPQDILEVGSPYRLNGLYYINKQIIPALQRVLGLVGADLGRWFSEMPRPARASPSKSLGGGSSSFSHRMRIDHYYCSKHCVVCGEIVQGDGRCHLYLCGVCLRKEDACVAALIGRTAKLEGDIQHLNEICRHCGGGDWLGESGSSSIKCTSLACSVYYERRKVQRELHSLSSICTGAKLYPKCVVEWF